MATHIRNKFTVLATTSLLTLMLASAPASAQHDHDIVAPLIAGFALGALINYGHSSRHYYHYQHQHQHHGHYRKPSGHGSGHSSGHGNSHGYRKHYQKSHRHYSQKGGHSSSHGGGYKPRRKH